MLDEEINRLLAINGKPRLTDEQAGCLRAPDRLAEAGAVLEGLKNRYLIDLPLARASVEGGPFEDEEEARSQAEALTHRFPVVCIQEMATDESRSTGVGNEFFVNAYEGEQAMLALGRRSQWPAVWVQGAEQ